MSRQRREKPEKKWKLLLLAAAVFVVAGVVLVILQQGNFSEELRTAVRRGGLSNDYRTATGITPSYSSGTTTALDCDESYDISDPNAAAGDLGTGQVAGVTDVKYCEIMGSVGMRGAVGPEPRDLQFKKTGQRVTRRPINGKSAIEILQVVCEAKKELPECGGADSHGCAWVEWGKIPRVKLHGLLEKVGGKFKLFAGVVFAGDPPKAHSVDKVYTAADKGDEIPYELRILMWQLSPADRAKLRAKGPVYEKIADVKLRQVYEHELEHWKIFSRFVGHAESHVNGPGAPNTVGTAAAIAKAISKVGLDGWKEIDRDEGQAHEDYHTKFYSRIFEAPFNFDGTIVKCQMSGEELRQLY